MNQYIERIDNMNDKAYVIMQGSYSDRHVVKVCLDQKLAREITSIHNKQTGYDNPYYIEEYDISHTPCREYAVLQAWVSTMERFIKHDCYPEFCEDTVYGEYPDIRYIVRHDEIIVNRYIPIDSMGIWDDELAFIDALDDHITQKLIDSLCEQLRISGKDEIIIDE